ncbi:MAG: glycoside hydrolase family 13 protein, partial [Candidatus Cloacimonetes bacterium]|nr:glycoside hydrolase family 13 protein [Candidatus Cloacimonadota bacterium]
WFLPDCIEERIKDGMGGENGLLIVEQNFPPLTKTDLNQQIFTFNLRCTEITELINPITPERVEIKFKAYRQNLAELQICLADQKIEKTLTLIDSDRYFDYFSLDVIIPAETEFIKFYLILSQHKKKIYLGVNGFCDNLTDIQPFIFKNSPEQIFNTPDWVKHGIIYQIFPDRFYNGNHELDQDFSEWYYQQPAPGHDLPSGQEHNAFSLVDDWSDSSSLRADSKSPSRKANTNSFFGGDIPGVMKKLDYLSDLGITIIYFNPVFPARSNHHYDAADFLKIDPHLGSEQDFRELVSTCHQRGIKVILDVAFNHTGDTFWAFRDAVEKGPESEFYSWYEWKKWPLPSENNNFNPSDYYNCWWGFAHMPELDFDRSRLSPFENQIRDLEDADVNWPVVNHILDAARFWLKDMDIDGFRLDVPNEVPFWFWKIFREKVKSIKSEAYLVGEIWHDAREWVSGNYFDAVMNYAHFRDPVLNFFNLRKSTAEDFDARIRQGLVTYPRQAVQVMMNLLDSHDTYRFLEIADGDHTRLKLAVLFQMTFVGTPHIWYGDEIGMRGGKDPDCRRPFDWDYTRDQSKTELRDYFRNLIRCRKEHSELRIGEYRTLLAKDGLIGYKRTLDNEECIIIINNQNKKIDLKLEIQEKNVYWKDLLSKRNFILESGALLVHLSPWQGVILKKIKKG